MGMAMKKLAIGLLKWKRALTIREKLLESGGFLDLGSF